MLPASGYTTARAKPTATAASTALPPRFMISTPAWLASGASLATIPCVANTGARPALYGQAAGNRAGCRLPAYVAAPVAGDDGVPTSVAADVLGRELRQATPSRSANVVAGRARSRRC